MKRSFLWIFLLAASTSWAGRESNGGNSVVCFANNPEIPEAIRKNGLMLLDEFIPYVTSVETFDLYQAKEARNSDGSVPQLLEPVVNEKGRDYEHSIQNLLEVTVPGLARLMKEREANFAKNLTFEQHGLKKIDDTKEVNLFDWKHCVLVTLAAQYKKGETLALHFDDRPRLQDPAIQTEWSKGALWLHELVYRGEIDKGEDDSTSTRLIVGKILKSQPLSQLLDELNNLGLRFNSYAEELSQKALEGSYKKMLDTFYKWMSTKDPDGERFRTTMQAEMDSWKTIDQYFIRKKILPGEPLEDLGMASAVLQNLLKKITDSKGGTNDHTQDPEISSAVLTLLEMNKYQIPEGIISLQNLKQALETKKGWKIHCPLLGKCKVVPVTLSAADLKKIQSFLDQAQKHDGAVNSLFRQDIAPLILSYYEATFADKIRSIPLSSQENNRRLDNALAAYLQEKFSNRAEILSYGKDYKGLDSYPVAMKLALFTERFVDYQFDRDIKRSMLQMLLKQNPERPYQQQGVAAPGLELFIFDFGFPSHFDQDYIYKRI